MKTSKISEFTMKFGAPFIFSKSDICNRPTEFWTISLLPLTDWTLQDLDKTCVNYIVRKKIWVIRNNKPEEKN